MRRPVRAPSPALSRMVVIVTAIAMVGYIALLVTDWITGRTLTATYVAGAVLHVVAPLSMGIAGYVERRRRPIVPRGRRLRWADVVRNLRRPRVVLALVAYLGCLGIVGVLTRNGADLR